MKEQVTKFNFETAFKALNEIEMPKVGGVKPNKTNHKELRESMRPTPKTDCLLEDYYDVNNTEDLTAAKEDRAEEVAQAKLAKIEKIVDLDAETPEDIQPSYVGKTIVQCPQCMTLFYRDPADIHVSEEDPTIVNVGEQCPNCNNDAGYTVIGKVAAEEAAPAVEETNELDLNFEEPVAEEGTEEAAPAEEVPAEENAEEEINLEPVETEEAPAEEEKPEEEEEEKKEESFAPHSENILAEQVENALKEDVDELSKKLKEHDEYIKVLQDEIKAEEEAVKNAKNDFIKKMHEKNLESLKDALDKAIPEEVKAEAAINELPTAEDAAEDMTKNESLKESVIDIYDGTGSHTKRENGKQYIEMDNELVSLAKSNPDKEYHYHTDDNDFEVNIKEIPSNIKIIKEALKEDINSDIEKALAKNNVIGIIKNDEEIEPAIKNRFTKVFVTSKMSTTDIWKAVDEIKNCKEDCKILVIIDSKIEPAFKAVLPVIITGKVLKESLCEEEEKFPNPDKHELVDTVDGVEIYHCKNCGKYGAKINDKVVKKDSVEEIKDCIAGKCNEEVCPKCGKDVEDPCETDKEAYHCKNNLDDDFEEALVKNSPVNINIDAHEFGGTGNNVDVLSGNGLLGKKEGLIPEIGLPKVPGLGENCEKKNEALVKNSPLNVNVDLHDFGGHNNDVDVMSGKKLGEEKCENCEEGIGTLGAAALGAVAGVGAAHIADKLNESSAETELAAFVAGLDESCKTCEESVENEIKVAEFEKELDNKPLTEDGEKCDIELMKEIDQPMSFEELINNPTFKKFGESLTEEDELKEELPAEVTAAAEVCIDNLEKLNAEDQAYVDSLEAEKPVEDVEDEDNVEELYDSYINSTISSYLTEVYENVKDFTATECVMFDKKLIIEGNINFKSGKTKATKFEFTEAKHNVYEGFNKDLAGDGKFTLYCFREGGGRILMAESLAYSYKIGENLVEGLVKTED